MVRKGLDSTIGLFTTFRVVLLHTQLTPFLSLPRLIVNFTPDAVAGYYEYYAGLAYSWEGEIIQSDNVGENIYMHYAPIG